MEKTEKPDCYKCVHRLEVPGSAHSRCNNHAAKVSGHAHGVRSGWFMWPVNFDPTWLVSCNGFSADEKDKTEEKDLDPLLELMGMLR